MLLYSLSRCVFVLVNNILPIITEMKGHVRNIFFKNDDDPYGGADFFYYFVIKNSNSEIMEIVAKHAVDFSMPVIICENRVSQTFKSNDIIKIALKYSKQWQYLLCDICGCVAGSD